MSAGPQGIRERRHDGGAWVWELCDAARSNPVSPTTLGWIARRAAELDDGIVVLRGEGHRVFCGGFDLDALAEASGDSAPDVPLGDAVAAMRSSRATFVAAIEGVTVGAGVELACACDLRVARTGVSFEVPAVRLGVVYRAEGLALLQHVFGPAIMRRMILLGERIAVEEAAARGAIDRLVEPAAFEATLDELVATLLRSKAAALRANRDVLRAMVAPLGPEALAWHEQARTDAFADARARLRAQAGLPNPPTAGLGLRPMAIKDDIDARQKQARRDRDEPTLNVIGMLKNRVITELKSGSGVVEDDALWLAIIGGYVKQLRKSIPEFEKAGERAKQALADVEFEIRFCEQFLPTRLDEAATEALVRKVVAEQGLADQGAKASGRVMGLLMKEHRDALDGDITRAVVARVLAGG